MVQSLVVPCNDLAETLDFFTEKNEFRLHRIYPAEDPSIADIENHDLSRLSCDYWWFDTRFIH